MSNDQEGIRLTQQYPKVGRDEEDSEMSSGDELEQVNMNPSADSEVIFKKSVGRGRVSPPCHGRQSRSPTPTREAPPLPPKRISTPRYEGVPSLQFGTSSPSQIRRPLGDIHGQREGPHTSQGIQV